jgi:hypothetical protein
MILRNQILLSSQTVHVYLEVIRVTGDAWNSEKDEEAARWSQNSRSLTATHRFIRIETIRPSNTNLMKNGRNLARFVSKINEEPEEDGAWCARVCVLRILREFNRDFQHARLSHAVHITYVTFGAAE